VTDRLDRASLHVSVGAAIAGICWDRWEDKRFQGGEGDDDYCCAHFCCAPCICSEVRTGREENFDTISGGLWVERCIGDKVERLTARSIVDGVVRCGIHNETAEADDDCDKTKGENTNQTYLLTPAEL
jgi:hypothetical protein